MKNIFAVFMIFFAFPFLLFAQTGHEVYRSNDEAVLIGVLQKDGDDIETLYVKSLACKRLGLIGTKQCVPALTKMLGGKKTAHYARYALETIQVPEVDIALRESLKVLDGEFLAGVLNSIGVRRDGQAVLLVVPLLKHSDPGVAQSAFGCLGYIGTPEAADELLKAESTALLKKYHGDAMFQCARHCLAEKHFDKAAALYAAVQNGDYPVYQKNAAVKSQTKIVDDNSTIDDLPVLLQMLYAGKSEDEIALKKTMLLSACTHLPKDDACKMIDRCVSAAPVQFQPFLLELLKEIGGSAAVTILEQYAWGNNDLLKDKATEVFGSWRSPEENDLIAAACLKLAKEATEPKYKNRGIRGYIRLPRQYGSIPEEQKIEMVNVYLTFAERKDDKLLVLDVFSRNPSEKMLEQAVQYLNDPDMKEKAAESAIIIGELLPFQSPAIAEAMKKAISVTENDSLKNRAKVVLDKQ